MLCGIAGNTIHATLREFHSTSGDKKVCFLCESSVDVKFEPCGHALMCHSCADRAKKCPLCKVCSLCVHYFGQELKHWDFFTTCFRSRK